MISNLAKDLKIYNSISGKKESFIPIEKNNVGMYVCGPTVYSNAHLGNCRTFISFDLIFRYLTHLGFKVRYVRNLTDVGHLENEDDTGEDKVSKKAIVFFGPIPEKNALALVDLLDPSIIKILLKE